MRLGDRPQPFDVSALQFTPQREICGLCGEARDLGSGVGGGYFGLSLVLRFDLAFERRGLQRSVIDAPCDPAAQNKRHGATSDCKGPPVLRKPDHVPTMHMS